MYVVPAARRSGLARLMLAHLEATARDAGADVVLLETGLEQPEGIALYEASGYERGRGVRALPRLPQQPLLRPPSRLSPTAALTEVGDSAP